MRAFLLPLALVTAEAMHAQPGIDLFADPCATGSYGVALQTTARPDLQVATYGIGTDDEPSSTGNCVRDVIGYPHTQFLMEQDRSGNWLTVKPTPGDVLHPDSLNAGIKAGRLRWGAGQLTVCYQGYGAAHNERGWQLVEPRTWERSVVRIEAPEAVYLSVVHVSCTTLDGVVTVRGSGVVQEGTALRIP